MRTTKKHDTESPGQACRRGVPLTAAVRAGVTGLLVGLTPAPTVLADDLPVVLRDQTGAVVRFDGANLPGQPFANAYGGRSLRIDQSADRATLHWESFNISKDNEVIFDQPRASSIALNRVLGTADLPSVIDGRLTANGRVFLINQNGVLFGPNARVDTRSLVASTLDIDDELYQEVGFENAINEDGNPAAFAAGGPMGEIRVEAGAQIRSGRNGRVMLLAPRVSNAGEIESPEGQIILAAAEDEVYIAPAGEDDPLRGLLVGVKTGGEVTNLGKLVAERGDVSLLGLAVNQQGLARATTSVSLNGSVRLVAQDMNGTAAGNISGNEVDGFRSVAARAGEVRLGTGSVTEVVADADPATAPDTQAQALSRITIQGERILFERGSRTTATGGEVVVEANAQPKQPSFDTAADPEGSSAGIRLESGAVIDVSGDDTTEVSVARNLVEIEARGNELADAPQQRDGVLDGKTLKIDVRKGAGFLNVDTSGAIQRGVNERLSAGGRIELKSRGRIEVESGATLDISGGAVTSTGAKLSTSKLVTRDGRVVDIAEADPNLSYAGVLGELEIEHAKWGVTEAFRMSRGSFEPGYVEGKDAGTLTLTAPGLRFDGDLIARTTVGRNQRRQPVDLGGERFAAVMRDFDQLPRGGELVIKKLNINLQDLVIGSDGALPALDGHPAGAGAAFVLDPAVLAGSGVSRIDIDNAGRIIVNRDLALPAFSDLELLGTQVWMQADVSAPGGRVALEALRSGRSAADLGDLGSLGALLPTAEHARVNVGGKLDVSGRWVNDSAAVNPQLPTALIVTDGGDILLHSARDIEVGAGAVLNVDGGAHLGANGDFAAGRGGSIALQGWTSGELGLQSRLDLAGELRGFGMGGGGRLAVEAGRIRIAGAGSDASGDYRLQGSRQFGLQVPTTGAQPVLTVGADTFQRGGFQAFDLTALRDDLEVAAGTEAALIAATPVLDPVAALQLQTAADAPAAMNPGSNDSPFERLPSADSVAVFTRAQRLPAFKRTPVDLRLASGDLGQLVLGSNSSLLAEPGADIRLTSGSNILIDGTVSAPAGTIEVLLDGAGDSASIQDRIWLGPHAALLAAGVVRVDPVSATGRRIGEVLDAGRVSLRAQQGSLLAEAGAHIGVDAAVGTLDLGAGGMLGRREVAGAAGSIELSAAESLIYTGTLSARDRLNAPGGSLSLRLDPNSRGAAAPDPDVVDFFHRGETVVRFEDFSGTLPGATDTLPDALIGTAHVPVSQLVAGGFDSFDLSVRTSAVNENVPDRPDSIPVIEFTRDTALGLDRRIRLDAPVIRTTGAARVDLSAPHVVLGSTAARVRLDGATPAVRFDAGGDVENNADDAARVSMSLDPSAGAGRLRVDGELVEFAGELVTRGFGGPGTPAIDVNAKGDVRLRGVRVVNSDDFTGLLRSAGDLHLNAQRVHATTLSEFALEVVGAGGAIEIHSPSAALTDIPLSIGSRLRLAADRIRQFGNLFAPLGEIALEADSQLLVDAASLTSTSAQDVQAPFFRTQPDGSLVFPNRLNDDGDIVFTESVSAAFERALPQQRMHLSAPDIQINPDAVFDLRGGTEARATEFVPGPGGSRDILLADIGADDSTIPNPAFAIVPHAGEFAPYDPLETPLAEAIQGFTSGDSLLLDEGIAGLPAGEYAILPPRYALFGGYLVTPVAGTRDLTAGAGRLRADGAPVLSGRYGVAGSDAVASRSQGFAIVTGAQVRQRAEYRETALAEFYGEGNARRPQDAGTLSLEAGTALRLEGRLAQGGASEGLGSQVDIVADAIRIREQASGQDGIELLAVQLEALGADSLLIGGSRRVSPDGLVISARADAVEVAAGVELEVPELILVGDEVRVGEAGGASTRLSSSREAGGERETLIVAGDGGSNGDAAVVAVSDRRLELSRPSPTGTASGQLEVTAGSRLEATGAVVADVAGDAVIAGRIEAADGARVSLGAAGISLGETDGRGLSYGLILSNANLAGLAGSDLVLRSGTTIEVFGKLADPATGNNISFDRLELDAQGVVGRDNDGLTVGLDAGEIRLGNSGGGSLAEVGLAPAAGGLELLADRLRLEAGDFALQGFGRVTAQARESLLVFGTGELGAEAPLTIDTPVIAGAAGADSAIRARGGALAISGGDAAAELPSGTGLAAALRLEGTAVHYSGRTVLRSGRLTLQQTGDPAAAVASDDLVLGAGAIIDVGGRDLDFGPETVGTPGGDILLRADTGNVRVDNGVVLNVAPGTAGGGWAGTIRIDTPAGEFRIADDAELRSGLRGGGFILDARRLDVAGDASAGAFGALNDLLGSGFSVRRDIRLREQSILIGAGETLRSHSLRAVSDTGDVRVAGSLDASGLVPDSVYENGGRILLAAGDRLDIESTAVLRATGTPAANGAPRPDTRGGEIDLIALDADGDDPDGLRDRVEIAGGARFDTRGGAAAPASDPFLVRAPAERDGVVRVHTRRLDSDQDGQTETLVAGSLDAQLTGVVRAELIATWRIDDTLIDAADISAWRAETEAFLQAAPASVGGFTVLPGLSVESAGDLVLADDWDFQGAASAGGWRFGQTATDPGRPGHLTLRAADELRLQGDLSDSFFDNPGFGFFLPGLPDRLDTNPFAWSFNLVAGADASAADPLAAGPDVADLVLDPAVRIRTGSGDLQLAASGDIRFGDGAAVYTAGRDRGLSPNIESARPSTGIFTTEFTFNDWMGEGAIFPVDGGDVSVRAGGNILGATAPALPTEWQPRIGEPTPDGDPDFQGRELALDEGAVPSHWGLAFHRFANGIGALGGGEVDIRAGGDLRRLTLAIPTTGRTLDGAVTDTNGDFVVAQEITEVAGGGVLRVGLGGDMHDSLFYLGDGVADIRVAGTAGAGDLGHPLEIVAGGDSRVRVTSGGDLDIARMQDFGMVGISPSQGLRIGESATYFDNAFYTYTETASLDLRALAGDLSLSGTAGDSNALAPNFRAASLSADLRILENMTQLPAARGQLDLLAGRDLLVLTQAVRIRLRQSDQDRALLPDVQTPAGSLSSLRLHAEVPVHLGDPRPNLIVARDGSIETAGTPFWELDLAKATHVQAGRDILNVSAKVQNTNDTDISSFIAGRDIRQLTQRDPATGEFLTFREDSDLVSQFEIAGPGVAEFLAGRSIRLGTSDGIETVGNIKNRFLADTGARLITMAGLGGDPDYAGFIQAYLVDGVDTGEQAGVVDYREELAAFLQTRDVAVPAGDPVAAFRGLARREQRQFLSDILFTELRESGVYAQTSGTEDFSRGFAAIDTLFPQQDPDGGISMLLSQVQTLDGGGIDMLVPGGSINAGAASDSLIDKGASELGIVAARTGDVNIFVDRDLLVNSTRVFALQGDLLVWSSNGSIDAGKGAKTVASIPAPITRIGPSGETVIEFPPAVEGSGLQGVNAFLFAPRGAINAGDAGIRTSGNLTLAATEVIGADNIDVGGVSVGVPVASSGVGASFAGVSNVASSTSKLAEDSTASIGGSGDDGQAGEQSAAGILSVKVVGFGDCPADDPACNSD
ncbi:hypothetical protein TspCOW1_01530 [Thiohalobacter sp. COW1]|uniref:filamentous hemagglutinin family protein n=1 Tax=Thiohalobacter sp. COW1 TaxID=2795687 RepID=UPI001916BD30|nr:filamentous hemagglutinin family protein [Thiohalobacter sp. COW1]BCO30050.1 hypothetical protein TspCOW1_01530 [Thiohalobacter sp. COW1]